MSGFEFILISIAFVIFGLWFLMGHKYAVIRSPRGFPRRFWLGAVVFVIWWQITVFNNVNSQPHDSFVLSWLAFGVPVLLFTLPVYWIVLLEFIKETNFYRKLAIIGIKQGSGRFGGVREYFKNDCTYLVNQTLKTGAPLERESTFYLGKTYWATDFQITGRHIGIRGENHKIVIGPSGFGKSLECITSALTMWQGGGLVFDIKGEHWNTVIRHKSAEKHLVDPFGYIIKDNDGTGWNPLAEIAPQSSTAREDIARMCDAIFLESRVEGNAIHFKEMAVKTVRGFMAHVRTTYPPHLQNLPTVYDLFTIGYPRDEKPPKKQAHETIEELDEETGKIKKVRKALFHPSGKPVMIDLTPEERFNRLIMDMFKNEACGGAAKVAATSLMRLEGPEKSGVLSTALRAIDWVNGQNMRRLLSAKSTFSLDCIKKNEAWVNLVIPEKYLKESMLFVRLFFQRALDSVDEYSTPNAGHHKRRMLFLFEEFEKFGPNFQPAIDVVNFKRSSRVMGVFVVQNKQQIITNNKDREQNFFSNSDTIYLGIDDDDNDTAEDLSKSLGETENRRADGEVRTVRVMSPEAVRESLKNGQMIVLPAGKNTKPLILDRQACFKVFPWTLDNSR